jgi:hypothetical protein
MDLAAWEASERAKAEQEMAVMEQTAKDAMFERKWKLVRVPKL